MENVNNAQEIVELVVEELEERSAPGTIISI